MGPAWDIVNPYGKASAVNATLPAWLCRFPVYEAKLSEHQTIDRRDAERYACVILTA